MIELPIHIVRLFRRWGRLLVLTGLVLLGPAVTPALAQDQPGIPLARFDSDTDTSVTGEHLITMTLGATLGVALVLAYHALVPPEVVIGPGTWAVGAAVLGLIIGDAWYQAGVFPPRQCPG